MEKNRVSAILFFIVLLLHSPSQSVGKNQIEALSGLYKAKLSSNSSVDRSHFNATHNFPEVQVLPQNEMKEKDRIERLPGQPPARFKQYGGYVTVNHKAGRAFYYYFVEAQRSSKKLPLLLWLNGGPGCSSLAYGAMQELGPFRVKSDGKTLFKNKFAWNHAANVLFLESPAGVGFSYSNKTSDYEKNGDRNTAHDNYAFLLNWLERFPEYKKRDFYISGESYAGHYVPQLAHAILTHNKMAKRTVINLKGILIGNAVINDETDTKGMYEYFATHALVSNENWNRIQKFCHFKPEVKSSAECIKACDEAEAMVGSIDIYNIYAPLCANSSLTNKPKKASILDMDPCSDYYTYAYLNRPDVQEAIHANVTKLDHDWEPCSDVIKNWGDSPSTVIPLLKEFMANGLRVWIFSGDTDGRIPVTSTKYSIEKMKLKIKNVWHPWYLSGEVGGYTQVYQGNLTFTTIRGAGHQVPSYQPAKALSLIMHFLGGTGLPDSSRH